ncbi:MAG: PilZ domain-containing protein [Proteobacteria bacterium]|nr:PilZ domain-containing protein [Pseudomonadota bacterium]
MSDNRRQFSRVDFNARIMLRKGDHDVNAALIDIALKGALVEIDDEFPLNMDEICNFELHLNGTEIVLSIQAQLVYLSEDQKLGFKFIEMELDTLTHLRRLIELNIGDPKLVQKELSFF